MVSTSNLISYWKLDEASGTFVDSHGSNDSTAVGAGVTYGATGKINDCADFEASSTSYINFGNDSSLNPSHITLNAWVKPESFSSTGYVFGKWQNTGSAEDCYAFGVNTSGNLTSEVRSTSGNLTLISTGYTLSTGTWAMISLTYDGTTAKLYINASEVASSTAVNGNFNYSGYPTMVGALLNTGALDFDGLIDEPCIFSEALSQTDLSNLYNSDSGLAYPFSSNVSVYPSTVTLSTSEESPSYFINITGGAIGLNATVFGASTSVPKSFYPSVIELTLDIGTVTIPLINPNSVGKGTIGTKYIRSDWPFEEGLIAGTTIQTRNPNLEPLEEGTW